MKRSKKRRKTILRKRFIFWVVCIAVFGAMFGVFGNVSASKATETFVLTVSYGDTLWDIAKENNPQNKDVRKVIDDIIRLNRLTNTSLCCGDELIIPVY